MLEYLDLGSFRLGDTSASSITDVKGLTGIPGVRGDVYDRPEADGSVEPTNQYKTARFITVEGECWGASIDAAWATWDLLQGALDDAINTAVLLKWLHTGGLVPMQTTVRFIGDATAVLSEDSIGPFLKYQAQFRAADPLLYSQASQAVAAGAPSTTGGFPIPIPFPIPFGSGIVGGTVSARNGGNTAAWPVIQIDGPIVNPVVGNLTTGKFLFFDGLTLAVGESLIIVTNPSGRGATVAGVSKLGTLQILTSTWPTMTKQVTETWQFYANGGGTSGTTNMTISWRDTYVS